MSDDDSYVDTTPRRGGGRQPGCPNYQNNILIRVVDRILPNGNEGWCLVALGYQKDSGEEILHSEDDLKKNLFCKLCNNMKKPTGKMGADTKDCINCCIVIERKILDKTSSGILGASSEEDVNPSLLSSLSVDEEYKEESDREVILGMEIQPQDFASFSQPPALPPMVIANGNGTQLNETTEDNNMSNTNAVNKDYDHDAPVNDQDNGDNLVVASGAQVTRRSTTSSSIARAGGQSTTPIPAFE
jgi:hypothetical protein